jgi:two-component system, chemotaxis family, sensor kinase CheA
MAIDLTQFHQVFIEESLEGLDTMESALMDLNLDNLDAELINSIFRCAHSIKGGGATLGFTAIAEFTHVLETLLDQVRDKKRGLKSENVNLFLRSVDCMREMLNDLKNQKNRPTETSNELKRQFQNILDDGIPGNQTNAIHESQPMDDGDKIWQIRFKPDAEILKTGNDPLRILSALADLGKMDITANLDKCPNLDSLDPEKIYLSWDILLHSKCSESDIKEVFEWVIDTSLVKISQQEKSEEAYSSKSIAKPLSVEYPKINIESLAGIDKKTSVDVTAEKLDVTAANGKSSSSSEATSIRVGIDKIDSLINMVGELVITQSMLGQLGSEFNETKLPKLIEGLAQLEQNTRELQESVMRIRMLPISFVFSRFPRMARDLSQQLNKKIRLEMLGEQTELDKTVMEKIGDPLVHLVRNSIDHGIETPQERIASGKSDVGLVQLNAYHQGGNVVIEISDDGKGLNCEKIRSKAIEKGLITELEAENMPESEVYELIFKPGFSTADTVSEVSGRGVGMDVVRRNIQALNGIIEIESKQGLGSKIRIRLPLTLAILDGQLVKVGSNIYVFPLVSIVESMRCRIEGINRLAGGGGVFRLRDEYVPIIELSKAFNVEPQYQTLDQALMVVVESDEKKVGIVVDELLAQQQVVIKSLEQNYKRINGVSGATILGDGTVALILDIAGVVDLADRANMPQNSVVHLSQYWRKQA